MVAGFLSATFTSIKNLQEELKTPGLRKQAGRFYYRESVFLAIKSSSDKRLSLVVRLLICVLNRWGLHKV